MTAKEVEKIIKEKYAEQVLAYFCDESLFEEKIHGEDKEKIEWKGLKYNDWKSKPIETEDLGKIEFIDEDGVHVDGQEIGVIFKVQDFLFKVLSYYSSWDNSEWDISDMYHVEAKEKTITIYESVK